MKSKLNVSQTYDRKKRLERKRWLETKCWWFASYVFILAMGWRMKGVKNIIIRNCMEKNFLTETETETES